MAINKSVISFSFLFFCSLPSSKKRNVHGFKEQFHSCEEPAHAANSKGNASLAHVQT